MKGGRTKALFTGVVSAQSWGAEGKEGIGEEKEGPPGRGLFEQKASQVVSFHD